MSVSILLLALWGRAVVIDTDRLAESLSPLARSSVVMDFVGDWMSTEMVEAGADPAMVEPAVDGYLQSSGIGAALDQFVVGAVHAAASTDPEGASIDMAALVSPAVPELTMALVELGYPVTEPQVADVVERFDPLVVRQPGSEALVGPASQTAARLGTAALLALLALVGLGASFVVLSEDRVAGVRRLMNRVAVGSLSFAVFLRVGSWVLDPAGGRAPVQETISHLARSKWLIPLEIALVAAVAAASIFFGRRWLRRGEVIPLPDGRPIPRPERPRSLSGRR